MSKWKIVVVILLLTVPLACDKSDDKDKTDDKSDKTSKTQKTDETDEPTDEPKAGEFQVESPAIERGTDIPKKFTCDGKNISPPLNWSNAPEGTSSFVVALLDPDAPEGTFHHWAVYSIPGGESSLTENVPAKAKLESGAMQAKNQFGDVGYGGPCPPKGEEHTYVFRVMALDTPGSSFSDTPDAEDVLQDVTTNILAEATMEATYARTP